MPAITYKKKCPECGWITYHEGLDCVLCIRKAERKENAKKAVFEEIPQSMAVAGLVEAIIAVLEKREFLK